jgi:hypothetical protein
VLSSENQTRLVEKLGENSEAFARSVFAAWDVNNDGVLTKEEILHGLYSWKKDTNNPAINALAGKIWEELITSGGSFATMTLEKFQELCIMGSRRHNLPFFAKEENESRP